MDLTKHGRELLDIIRARRGDWVTRAYIARRQSKSRLNIWETKLLDDLVEAGLIEGRKQPIKSPIGYEWQYRAKGQDDV